MASLLKSIWSHSIVAFGVQIVAMIIVTVLGFIPVIGMYFGLLTYVYLPTMALVEALKLFPHSDGPIKWLAGLVLGMVIYSLAWGIFKTRISRKSTR